MLRVRSKRPASHSAGLVTVYHIFPPKASRYQYHRSQEHGLAGSKASLLKGQPLAFRACARDAGPFTESQATGCRTGATGHANWNAMRMDGRSPLFGVRPLARCPPAREMTSRRSRVAGSAPGKAIPSHPDVVNRIAARCRLPSETSKSSRKMKDWHSNVMPLSPLRPEHPRSNSRTCSSCRRTPRLPAADPS